MKPGVCRANHENDIIIIIYHKGKGSLHTSQVAHQARAYPGFPGWDASPSQGYPQH